MKNFARIRIAKPKIRLDRETVAEAARVQQEDIRAKVRYVVVGIDDVALGLGNLRPIFGDGTIRAEALKWHRELQVT